MSNRAATRYVSDLPNKDGFKFKGVTHDGQHIDCIVKRDKDGIHRAYELDTGEPCFFKIQRWY